LISFTEPPSATPTDFRIPPAAAKRTASGLSYQVLKPGSGRTHPTETSSVTVHYSGWTTDGKLFDSSIASGKPISFRLNRVIPGWTEGVQLMVEGEKARFWIPESLAYKGEGPIFGDLVFDIELVKID
jgi:peptidylprolyl isomerase